MALAVVLFLVVPAEWCIVRADAGRQIKVAFEFRQSGSQSRDAVQGSGGVIITERGRARPSGRAGVQSTERKITRTTGLFTIVQDGGESMLLVTSQVPYPQVAYYRDYLTGTGYVATGVAFKDVGTSLKVRAAVLPGNQVKVRITPTISWFADDRSGVIEATEASTELIVPNGRPVAIGGATAQVHDLTRYILGFVASQSGSETLMTVRASVLE